MKPASVPRLPAALPAFVLAAALAAALPVFAEIRPAPGTPEVPAPPPPSAPKGFLLVDEGLWAQHLDQPEREFQVARLALDRKDLKAAVAAVRRAAGYVRAEGSRAEKPARAALLASAQSLADLAARLEQGLLPDADAVGPVFAAVHRELARHRLALARLAVGDDEVARAGEQLGAAADDARAELAWSGGQVDPEQGDLLHRIDLLSDQLQQDGATVDELTDEAMDELGRLLARP